MSGGQTNFDLTKHLEASRQAYDACLDHVEHDFKISDTIDASLNMHFVKFDGTGEPKFRELAKNLIDHIISYSIALTRRGNLDILSAAKLFQEARNNFNLKPESGEPGELLLYFLLETVVKAPQLICKIDLKTNRNDESKGADGIHALWDSNREKLVLFVGESKLHSSFSSAVSSAVSSIENLHKEHLFERDLLLTTKHFKHADEITKEKVLKILDRQNSTENYDLVQACLIGYDWSKYGDLKTDKRKDFIDQFVTFYKENIKDHRLKTLTSHLEGSSYKHLSFNFFFLPFRSVEEFRKEFNDCLTGG